MPLGTMNQENPRALASIDGLKSRPEHTGKRSPMIEADAVAIEASLRQKLGTFGEQQKLLIECLRCAVTLLRCHEMTLTRRFRRHRILGENAESLAVENEFSSAPPLTRANGDLAAATHL